MARWMLEMSTAKATFKDVSLRRILRLFRPYTMHLAVILFLALISAAIGLGPPLVMREIIDNALQFHNKQYLLEMVGLMIALPLLSGLVGVGQNHLNNKVGQSVMRDMRHSLFSNLQRQSMSFFTHSRSGEVIQRLTGDVQAVQSIVTGTVVSAITQIVIVISTAIILFSMDWRLTLLSMVIIPLFILPTRRVSNARKKLRIETQKTRGEMSSQLGEVFGVSGAMLTRIFGREPLQQQQFNQMNEKVLDLELRLNLIGRWYGMAMGILAPLGTAIIYLYGGFAFIDGKMTIGDIIAFTAYVGRLYGPISSLLNLHVETATALGIFQRIFEYMDLKSDIVDAPDAKPLPAVRGDIAYRNVSFAYQPNLYALRDISFEIKAGELAALVGPSGAGKSTLIGMLARLYDTTKGTIQIDGHDIKKLQLKSLREHIAFVTQESFLFHGTIGENLQFAKENATEREIRDACRQAYIHDFIASLPDGYQTLVGERGYRLSGGERQRIAIARAILKDPRILILDEATSHLDSQSEAYVQAALEDLMQNRTTLVIAHRLSTILAADKIIVLNEGQIVAQGTHAGLMTENGLYAQLYHTQFDKAVSGG